MKLSSLTSLAFQTNAIADARPGLRLSLAEVRHAADAGRLVEFLAGRFGDRADFSLLLANQNELNDVNRSLSDAAPALDGREQHKAGVSQNGLCLVMALILEAIQQQFISFQPPAPTRRDLAQANPKFPPAKQVSDV